MNGKIGFGLVVAALVAGSAALAVDAPQVISQRQDFYKGMGKSFKAVIDELKKSDASVAELQKNAVSIDENAPKLITFFPAGTGPEAGVKTAAKPEIWQKQDEFKKDFEGLLTATHNLNAAAKTGDVAAIKTAAGALGQACKTCHEPFRVPEQH